MAKTETVYTRVEPQLKANAEQILARLGLTPSEAINVFLNQVVLHNGLPFEVRIPDLTLQEAKSILLSKLEDGEESVKKEDWISIEESKTMLGL